MTISLNERIYLLVKAKDINLHSLRFTNELVENETISQKVKIRILRLK